MSSEQNRVIWYMTEKNLGALLVNGTYHFMRSFRQSHSLALEAIKLYPAILAD